MSEVVCVMSHRALKQLRQSTSTMAARASRAEPHFFRVANMSAAARNFANDGAVEKMASNISNRPQISDAGFKDFEPA